MGTKMAPCNACLFMGELEIEFLASAEYSPHFWIGFFEKINKFHDSIKFLPTVSETSVLFLDVEVNDKST